jgi:gamma-glutamylaminecyclotransferase
VLLPPTELFVYGSLKRGFRHHSELEGAQFLTEARTIPGYTLVSLGPYPALIVSGRDHVVGELYRVTAEHLLRLDVFEGSEYERGEVELASGTRAQAYLLRREHPAFASAPRIGRSYSKL